MRTTKSGDTLKTLHNSLSHMHCI